MRHVSVTNNTGGDIENEDIIEDMVISIDQINRKISSLKRLELRKSCIDLGKSDMPITQKFEVLTYTWMSFLNIKMNVGESVFQLPPTH